MFEAQFVKEFYIGIDDTEFFQTLTSNSLLSGQQERRDQNTGVHEGQNVESPDPLNIFQNLSPTKQNKRRVEIQM